MHKSLRSVPKLFPARSFFLSLRRRSGERTEERGILTNVPPLPGPLLHPMEEREFFDRSSAAQGPFVIAWHPPCAVLLLRDKFLELRPVVEGAEILVGGGIFPQVWRRGLLGEPMRA